MNGGRVIVWVNGTFGAGKTSTVRELQEVLPGSTVFDPESVGVYLRHLLSDGCGSDLAVVRHQRVTRLGLRELITRGQRRGQ